MYKVVSREFTSTRFEIYQSHDLGRLQALCYECDQWVACMEVVRDVTLRVVGCSCPTRDIALEDAIHASGLNLPADPTKRSKTLEQHLIDGNCQISTVTPVKKGINIHVYQWIAFWTGINVLSIDIDSNREEIVA